MKYIVASSKDWFKKHAKSKAYQELDIYEISKKEELTLELLEKIKPRFIFFPHWNWIVGPEIFNRYECVVFHTAPLPYGRGGSPVQNLILQGLVTSPVNALRMTDSLDGGPVYGAMEISLDGTIRDIFERIASVVEELILDLVKNEPTPVEQKGEPFYFKRLSPKDNELPTDATLNDWYNRIRMVDGEGYPPAFIKYGKYKINFSSASLQGNELTAQIRLSKNED